MYSIGESEISNRTPNFFRPETVRASENNLGNWLAALPKDGGSIKEYLKILFLFHPTKDE
jgi:hypothetical protein